MMSPSASGTGGTSHSDQRRAPRRPGLSSADGGRPDCQRTKKAYMPSWGVLSSGCSFGDGQGNHGALTEVNRVGKEGVKRGSVGQVILDKVSSTSVVVESEVLFGIAFLSPSQL